MLDLAESLLQAGSKMTALTDAARKGDTVVIRAFSAAGANVNFTEDGANPLHHAARRGHTDIVKLLIAAGADVNAHGNTRFADASLKDTPLYSAARGGHPDIAKALIAGADDPNAKNYYKRTSLHSAAVRFDMGFGKILVYSGSHINLEDMNRNNPTDLAHKNRYNYLGYDDGNDLVYEAVSSDSRDKEANKFQIEIAKAFLEASDHDKVLNKENKIPTDLRLRRIQQKLSRFRLMPVMISTPQMLTGALPCTLRRRKAKRRSLRRSLRLVPMLMPRMSRAIPYCTLRERKAKQMLSGLSLKLARISMPWTITAIPLCTLP